MQGDMLILWLHSNLLRLESRSHSGDDGDEDPPVPIPREQSAALPRLPKGNGRRQKLSSSTAKVVEKKRLRGRVRQFIGQRISAVRAERDEQTQKEKRLRCPSRHELNDVDEKANCRISIKNDRFSVEKRSFFLHFQGFSSCPFCAVLLGFLLGF